jgi:ketosteroid isomerase-like protein
MWADQIERVGLGGNELLLQRLFATVDRGSWAEMAQLYTDDAVYHRPGFTPVIGRAGIVDFYERLRPIASGRHDLERVLIAPDQGFCWGTFVGTLRTGEAVTESFADWYAFGDNRIAERRTFFFRPAI